MTTSSFGWQSTMLLLMKIMSKRIPKTPKPSAIPNVCI